MAGETMEQLIHAIRTSDPAAHRRAPAGSETWAQRIGAKIAERLRRSLGKNTRGV